MKRLTLLETYRLQTLNLHTSALAFPNEMTSSEKTVQEAVEFIKRASLLQRSEARKNSFEAACSCLRDFLDPQNNAQTQHRNFFYSIGGVESLVACIKGFAAGTNKANPPPNVIKRSKWLLELLEVLFSDEKKIPDHVSCDDGLIESIFTMLKEKELFEKSTRVIENILISRKYPFEICKIENFYEYFRAANTLLG